MQTPGFAAFEFVGNSSDIIAIPSGHGLILEAHECDNGSKRFHKTGRHDLKQIQQKMQENLLATAKEENKWAISLLLLQADFLAAQVRIIYKDWLLYYRVIITKDGKICAFLRFMTVDIPNLDAHVFPTVYVSKETYAVVKQRVDEAYQQRNCMQRQIERVKKEASEVEKKFEDFFSRVMM